LLNKLSIDREN